MGTLQGLYWTLPRDRVEEVYEDEEEDIAGAKDMQHAGVAKAIDDAEAPEPLERRATLVRPPDALLLQHMRAWHSA
jgi:hypothetical protein